MRKVWRNWALAGLVLATAAAPLLAQPPITVAPGNDSWTTPANSSQIDLGVFPLDLVFGPSPVVNPQVVLLSGVPLNPGGLGLADTLLERYPPSVLFNGVLVDTRTFSVEIKALRMKGQTTVNGVGFDVYVALSSVPSGPGTITARRTTLDGGRFDSSFPVLTKLIFIQQGVGTRSEIDCGLVSGCPAVVLNSFNNCWEVAFGPNGFNPANFGIPPINAGVPVDSDFDGVNDYVTVGRKRAGFAGLEFHVGRQPAPPWGICGDSVHDHAVYSLTHVSRPPDDCKQRTGTTTGTTQTLTAQQIDIAASKLCAAVAIDGTQPVDEDEPVTHQTNTVKKQTAGAKKPAAKPSPVKPKQ
jgi:hypothetical protein